MNLIKGWRNELAGKSGMFWIHLIILSYLCLTYLPRFGWWIAMTGTGLIILFSYIAWPLDFKARLGIPIKAKQYVISTVLLIIFFAASYFLMDYIRTQHHLDFGIGSLPNFIHIFFYTLNEELILGGFILLFLQKKYYRTNPVFISISIAVVFSVMHYIFYRWVFQEAAQGILSHSTLISLMLVGIIRNNLILQTAHIGYSWALHFSWMAIMFGGSFYYPSGLIQLSQVERFNLFIGNGYAMTGAFLFALVTSVWILVKK